jgi:hypothetical protein
VGTETLYRWKHKYGGMAVSKARRLRALEDENRRLKKLVADLALDNAAGLGSVSDRTILTHIHHDPCSPGVSERWLPSILRSPREAVSRAEEASRASFVGQTLTGSRSQCLIEVAEARPNNIG